jgi:glycosyltransferase involved in cell wall biosynthesis
MKIAVDARWIFAEISGVGTYTRELLRRLPHVGARHQFLVLFDDPVRKDRILADTGLNGLSNVEARVLPYGVFALQGQLRLPGLLRREACDVYHSPNWMIPLLAFSRRGAHRCRGVVTIHDVIPLIFPDHAPQSKKSRLMPVFRRLMMEIGRRADAIATVSEASRSDILKELRIPAERTARVRAIHNGVSPAFCPVDRARRENGARTMLYVGRADPYKNVTGLVRAAAEVIRRAPFPVELAIAGAPDPRYPEPQRLVQELRLDGKVKWLGYVEPERLVRLYQEADVLVHPSRYEGFGLQVIEAMASGLPVVCGRGGSLAEVAGDAALLCDVEDAGGFADAALRVLTDPELAGALRRKGLERARLFTWDRAAQATLALYEEVVSRG